MNCPFCKRLLYSRQHEKCGHCGEDLPESFRLTEEEMKGGNRAIEGRRAIAKEKEEAEREERQRKIRRRRAHQAFFNSGC